MRARSKARKRALDVLFEADQRGLNVLDVLEARLAEPGTEAPLPEYSATIVRGVVARWSEIEGAIAAHSRDWSVPRMAAVDRSLLRLAAWEVLFGDGVPPAVAVDEAVSLATTLSTDDSPAFVNGVLRAVLRASEDPPAGTPGPAATSADERPLD